MLLVPAVTLKNLTLPPFKSNKKTLFGSCKNRVQNLSQLAAPYILTGPYSFVPHPFEWFTETHQVYLKERTPRQI